MDVLIRGLLAGGAVRLLAVDATELSRKTAEIHGLSPGAARLAGECLVAGLLSSAHIDEDERITLQMQAASPRFSFVADVEGDGRVRARLTPADVGYPQDGIDGVLVAIKSNAARELYRGATPVEGTSVGDALLAHVRESGQLPAIVAIESRVSERELAFVGGYLVEPLPYSEEHPSVDLSTFERDYGARRDPEALVRQARGGTSGPETLQLLEERVPTWSCSCSRDKVKVALVSLGAEQLRVLAKEDRGAAVSCHFCKRAYTFTEEELIGLLAATGSPG